MKILLVNAGVVAAVLLASTCSLCLAQAEKSDKESAEQPDKERNGKSAAKKKKTPLTVENMVHRLGKISLAPDQKKKINPLIEKFLADSIKSHEEFEASLPENVREARAKESKRLKAKGKEGEKLRDALDSAVKLDAAQLDALQKYREQTKQLNQELREALAPILDAAQRKAVGLPKDKEMAKKKMTDKGDAEDKGNGDNQRKTKRKYAYCRFETHDKKHYGLVQGEHVIELDGSIFGDFQQTDKKHKLADVKLLVPCHPTNVYCLADNYRSHNRPQSKIIPSKVVPEGLTQTNKFPMPWLKKRSSLQRPNASVLIPNGNKRAHYEAEMVVVIGRDAKNVEPDAALNYVLGVTCGNDVTLSAGVRKWHVPQERVILQAERSKSDLVWSKAKSHKTFGPVGPYIVGGLDYDNLEIKMWKNGKLRQHDNTQNMRHSVAEIVSYLSQYVTLKSGDLIFTGTPGMRIAKSSGKKRSSGKSDKARLAAGDRLMIKIEGVGTLKNTVAVAHAKKMVHAKKMAN